MNKLVIQILVAVVGWTAFMLGLGAWLTTRFNYRVTPTHLEVTLFGLCVRRISLLDIESISRHKVGWGENWWNTANPFRRVLVIRRRSGLFRNFVITPWHRYVFRADLERAIANCHSDVYHRSDDGEGQGEDEETAQPG